MRAWKRGSVAALLLTLSLVLLAAGYRQCLTLQPCGGQGQPLAGAPEPLFYCPTASSWRQEDPGGDFALARYLSDGDLDPTFGVGGTVITGFTGGYRASALVPQPDGKLVAAGGAAPSGATFALARYRR